ncbi:MAG: DUF4388 domain-containing protein [Myxococcota bacterium]
MAECALDADLEAVRLASLLQLVESEMFDGWLTCPTGRIGFREGTIVAATCGELAGMDAIRELFLCPTGRVRLEKGTASGNPLGNALAVVMEGVRVADEWDRLAALVLDEAPGFEAPATGPIDRSMLDDFDGLRTTFEVVKRASLAPSLATDALGQLFDNGWLVEVAPARPDEVRRQHALLVLGAASTSPEPTEPEPAEPAREPASSEDYYARIEAGRSALKSGQHDDAEADFLAALAARPGDRIASQNLKRVRALRAQTA